ncbi:probable glycosyltransferase At5g03795 isoform X2 [Rhododendron vialii]|uniref:probable glycosyltransferase At5g03795 isoform X2 n=1 Tax=Rhododendron vialii TaxID=182163 RepID=UPI00265EA59E|nr:probable glycosyltransferase At5g03795 isoform X2 [Rhododendron vialii]
MCSTTNMMPRSASSNLPYSILILVFFLLTFSFVTSLVDFTLGPERSWISFHSPPWARRVGFSRPFSRDGNEELERPSRVIGIAEPPLAPSRVIGIAEPPSIGIAEPPLAPSRVIGIAEPPLAPSILNITNKFQNSSTESPATDTAGVIKTYTKLERLEAALAKARSSIREASKNNNTTSIQEDLDYVPRGPIYRNANVFHRSYLEMEKLFKIYVYEEGELPMFHTGPCRSIYSSEGRFIMEMEKGNFYRTRDPDEALVYFLPFSVVMMVQYLYVPGAHEYHAIGHTVADYVDVVSQRHPFWNRSLGADHFMLSCHDWGPHTTSYVPNLFKNSIRVLCNANTSEGFNPSKDASLPEINLKSGEIKGLIGGPSPSKRPILAFFAGRLHGHIRYLLLQQWKEKDQDVQVYDSLPKGVRYESMLKKSRFCLCPSGYEVASPRLVEAIYAECVPVLISDGYVPPLSDVLNWKAFSVSVEVKDIPNLKTILMGISQGQYLRLHRRVKQVQRHFVINGTPKRFDIFHMIVHSIWLRRLNVLVQD